MFVYQTEWSSSSLHRVKRHEQFQHEKEFPVLATDTCKQAGYRVRKEAWEVKYYVVVVKFTSSN